MNDRLHTDGSSQTGNQPIQLSPLDARRKEGPDCVSRDYPDPLVSDCDDLLRKDVSEELERKACRIGTLSLNPIGRKKQNRK